MNGKQKRTIAQIIAALIGTIIAAFFPDSADSAQSVALVAVTAFGALPDKDGDGLPDIVDRR
jgi:hypothetical protein